MTIKLFHLVTGQTIVGRLLNDVNAEQVGMYMIKNPLGVDIAPTDRGLALTTAPYAGIIGMIADPEVVNIRTIHVVGDPVDADEKIENVWLKATSGLQIAKP